MYKNEKVDYFFYNGHIVLFQEVAQETEALKPIAELTEFYVETHFSVLCQAEFPHLEFPPRRQPITQNYVEA
jgi:hypothetical protein